MDFHVIMKSFKLISLTFPEKMIIIWGRVIEVREGSRIENF